jgi:outer membrane protein TolC
VAQAYLNVVLKGLQSKIAVTDEQRYKEYEQVAAGKMKIGSLIENDYLKAKLDYENAKVETLKAKQNYQLALENIKYQINIGADTQLILSDSLNSAGFLLEQLPTQYDIAKRTEIEQLVLQQQNNKLQIFQCQMLMMSNWKNATYNRDYQI